MKQEQENITSVWKDYERGVMYNRTKLLYTETEQNYDFYFGNQWKNANLGEEKPIVKNIIKRIVKFKTGVVNTNAYAIVFNPNPYEVEKQKIIEQICKSLNNHMSQVWELQQADKKIKEALKDSCINSEGIIHSYYDGNEIVPEVIDKNNIYYGNENDSDIQNQPYIIISYRKTVQQVQEEARDLGIDEEKIQLILPDTETQEQAGYNNLTDEVSPMCLVLLKYYKKDGQVYYTKATKNVELEKDINTELTLYPIAHMVWEEVKGSARGNGEVKYLIPNQIEINRIAMRRAIAVKVSAFNKLVVNEELISNPSSLEKVGATIKVKGGATVEDVRKAVGYVSAQSMSSDASNLQQELQQDTADLASAGDTATGNVDPTKASGKAILAVQQSAQQPLNEQVDTYKTFIEDIARVWFDMWKTYKVDGLQVTMENKDENGETVQELITLPQELLQSIKANIKIEITPKSAYDRFAQEQSLENLFMENKITLEEYADALDEDSVMPKNKLKKIIEQRKINNQKLLQMQKEAQQKQFELEQSLQQEQTLDDMQAQAEQRYNNLQEEVMANEMQQV